jgi:large subunit ribosomal protein L19
MRSLDSIEKDLAKKSVPKFDVGDTVDVHVKIIEGDKERIQIFTGTVIAKRHEGLSETFTVRRIVQGEGVERIFPLHSPRVQNIVVKAKGKVRRAKLHYLRGRVGRAQKVEQLDQGVKPAEKPAEKPKVEAKVEEKKPEAPKPAAPAEAPKK